MLLKTISNERITTNKLLLDDLDLWYLFDSKSLKQEVEKKYYAIIKAILDGQITITTDWLETDEAKEYFNELANYDSNIFQSLTDEWDNILNGAYDNVDELLDRIYEIGKEKGYSNIRETIRWTNADKEAIRLAKDYNYHLIRKLSNDLRNNIRDKITEGVIGNVNPLTLAGEIRDLGVKPLNGSTLSPYQRGVMIARTETSRMQNTGMLQSYINEGYIEVKILTAEDDNVCRTCLEYAFEFNKDDKIIFSNRGEERVHNIIDLIKGGKFPPFHPNCRCTYLTVWESKSEPPENPFIVDLTKYQKINSSNISNILKNDSRNNAIKSNLDKSNIDSIKNIVNKFKNELKLNNPQKVANYFGLSYDDDLLNHKFIDDKNNCEILIAKSMTEGRNKLISATNRYNANFNLIDILRAYSEAPDLLKLSTKKINFLDRQGIETDDGIIPAQSDTLGNCYIYSRTALDYRLNHTENIYRTLLHEMGHNIYFNNDYGKKLTIENVSKFVKEQGFTSDYAYGEIGNNKYEEEIADAISMVSYKNKLDKSSALIKVPKYDEQGKHVGYEILNYEQWHERFYDYATWLEEQLNL